MRNGSIRQCPGSNQNEQDKESTLHFGLACLSADGKTKRLQLEEIMPLTFF